MPPGLVARNTISSALNVVGFSTTFTPFDRSHSVMPNAAFSVTRAIDPGVGGVAISVRPAAVST